MMLCRSTIVAIALLTLAFTPAIGADHSAVNAIQTCDLGDSAGITTHAAVSIVEACLDEQSRDPGAERIGASAPGGSMHRPAGPRVSKKRRHQKPDVFRLFGRAPAGHATAVVATQCPNDFGKPCFAGPSSIQDAIDHLNQKFPEGVRTILITPGIYNQSFATQHGWMGETHIVGVGPSRLLSKGPVQINAPADGVASTAWTFSGRGSVANLSFGMGSDPGDVGIRVTGIILLELYFENVSLTGQIFAGARGFDVSDIFGFLTIHNSSMILPCRASGFDKAAGFFVDQPQRPFTEITIHEGHYQVAGLDAGLGCVTFDIDAAPFGDDRHGMALEFVHLQCEHNATCFEIDSNDVHLEIGPLVWRRSPSGRFVRVVGFGTGSDIFIHGVTREAGRFDSKWFNVVPGGSMTISGSGEPTMPTFPGWKYNRTDGGPNTSAYFGTGSPGPPYLWSPFVTEPAP